MSKRFLAAAAVVVTCAFCLVSLFLPQNAEPQRSPYSGVLELWHVETFEGGSASRSAWLTARAAAFEKKHKGLYVHVSTLTCSQVEEKLADGATFDVASFGSGAGSLLLPYLVPIELSAPDYAKGDFLSAGAADGVQYAYCYSFGAYALFARKTDLQKVGVTDLAAHPFDCALDKKIGKTVVSLPSLCCGYGAFNDPLSALNQKGGFQPDFSLTQYGAYEKFVSGKGSVVLLGTQRDVYRLENRLSQGKIDDLEFAPLCKFTDLAQFAAVSAASDDKIDCCREFIAYLLSDEAQNALSRAYLLSPTLDIYADGWMSQLEAAAKNIIVENAFASPDWLLSRRGEK